MQVAAGFEDMEFLHSFKPFQSGFNLVCPVIDRFSPLSYCVADYIHRKKAPHSGYESCYRCSLDFVFTIHGLSLYREIGEECVQCAKLRKKYLDISMGPVPDEILAVAPAFYITQMDIFGPLTVYVPGHSMNLRNKKVIEAKIYALVFACPITKCVNMQVIENKAVDGILDGVQRLGCEVGLPKYILTDKDSGIMKALSECEIKLLDVQHLLYKENGIVFKTAPVSGHNFHGLVEKKIGVAQDCLEKMGVKTLRLHATGYQTLLKLVENDMNNLPMGYTYGRKADNSPMMRLIFPNLLKIGRNNHRNVAGPIKLPRNPGEILAKIEKGYQTFFEIWNTTMVPRLMRAPKWFDSKVQLSIGDLVYFRLVENELNSNWSVGKIVDVVYGRDGIVRKASVQYQNSSEGFDSKRVTERAARSLIRLFNIDDKGWMDDMSQAEKILNILEKENYQSGQNVCLFDASCDFDRTKLGDKLKAWLVTHKTACKVCCCYAHCKFESHSKGARSLKSLEMKATDVHDMLDISWVTQEEYEDLLVEGSPNPSIGGLTGLLARTRTDLNGADDGLFGC